MGKKLVIEIIAGAFVFLFVYAAVSKWIDFEKFSVQTAQSPILTHVSELVVWFIPGVELLISVFLCVPRLRLLGFYASFGLMVMFTAYIIAILSFSYHIPCSCGGILEQMGWTEHLVFNIVFVVLGFTGVWLESSCAYGQRTELSSP